MHTSTDRICEARVYRYAVGLVAGASGFAPPEREGLLLHVRTDDGREGWGEAAPLAGFSRESVAQAGAQLSALTDAVIGRPLPVKTPTGLSELLAETALTSLYPSVRWALDQALWSSTASAHRVPPPVLAGATPRLGLPVNRFLLAHRPADLRSEIQDALRAGYRAVKLKVGAHPLDEETVRVRAAAEATGGRGELRIDANRSFSAEQADAFLTAIADLDVAYVEEPVADPGLVPVLAERHSVPLALDETTREVEPEEAARSGAAVLVLKPTLLGGYERTQRFVRAARTHEADALLTSCFEAGVGHRSLAWLARALRIDARPSGLDTYRLIDRDLLTVPLRVEAGRLCLPSLRADRPSVDRSLIEAV